MKNISALIKYATILFVLQVVSSFAYAETTLKIATLAPDSTTWMKVMREGADTIEKRTEGRVKIKYYPGGVMGNDQAVLRKIRIGQLHGGAVTSGSLATIYPDAQIYSLPFEFKNLEEVKYVREHMDSTLIKGLEDKGLVAIGITNGGFAYFVGTKEATGLDDLRNYKVWIPQGDVVSASIFKTADISPIALPISDVYTALQTGLLDTVIGNPSSIIAFQWHTKVKYLTNSPIVFLVGMMVVDKKAFSKIEAADQSIVREVMMRQFKLLDDLNERDDAQALEALAANGIEFLSPTSQEQQSWRDLADRTLKQLGETGGYTVSRLQELRGYVKTFRGQQASLNNKDK